VRTTEGKTERERALAQQPENSGKPDGSKTWDQEDQPAMKNKRQRNQQTRGQKKNLGRALAVKRCSDRDSDAE
jgi:hypothetical protein